MVASLAQAVALVAHGNAFLSSGGEPPQLVPANSAFQYAGALEFIYPASNAAPTDWLRGWFGTKPASAERIDTSTAEWFRNLAQAGTKRLWLFSFDAGSAKFPPHVAVAFAGFSQWGILAEQASGGCWWGGTEQLINAPTPPRKTRSIEELNALRPPEAVGNRIWRVSYTRAPAQGPRPPMPALAEVREEFERALRQAIDFAATAKLEFWRTWLLQARAQLDSRSPQPRFHPDMLPAEGYSLEARQLLAAASSAWVFGGMGSWNDVAFEAELKQQYDRVTPALYAAVLAGVVAAANQFRAGTAADAAQPQ